MRKWFGAIVWLGVLGLAGATLAAIYGERSWILNLASHFRPHLVAASFVWLFLAIVQHRPIAAIGCAALLAVNAAPIVPYVIAQPQPAEENGTPLRAMTFNMQGRFTRRTALLEFVQAEQPDIIVLTELPNNPGWLVDSLGADYPYRADDYDGRPHDVLLFSRWPITRFQVDRSVHPALPVAAAEICREGREPAEGCLRLVALHAVAAFGGRTAARHDAQLALAARLLAEAPPGRAILAGDLNMTPWAPQFRRLLAATGLRDAALGRSVTGTWMSRQPMMGLAIDHVLASPEIGVRDYLVGPDLGSDHLPVVAGLILPRSETAP